MTQYPDRSTPVEPAIGNVYTGHLSPLTSSKDGSHFGVSLNHLHIRWLYQALKCLLYILYQLVYYIIQTDVHSLCFCLPPCSWFHRSIETNNDAFRSKS